MRKEIKHHIFTASLYEHNNGIYEYNIDNKVYVYRTYVSFRKDTIVDFNLPHLFELINICLKELNEKKETN